MGGVSTAVEEILFWSRLLALTSSVIDCSTLKSPRGDPTPGPRPAGVGRGIHGDLVKVIRPSPSSANCIDERGEASGDRNTTSGAEYRRFLASAIAARIGCTIPVEPRRYMLCCARIGVVTARCRPRGDRPFRVATLPPSPAPPARGSIRIGCKSPFIVGPASHKESPHT